MPPKDSDGQQNVVQPSGTLQKYAHYMSEEDQATYTEHVINDLRKHLSYANRRVMAISWMTSRVCTLVVKFPRNSSWILWRR